MYTYPVLTYHCQDADHIFADPMASLDAIEDSKTCPTIPLKNAVGSLRSRRVEKLSPARAVEPSRPTLLSRERFAHICSAKPQGPQSSSLSRHEFATGSDGFVGTELDIQHPASQRRPRTSNRILTKKHIACNKSELTLASGYLPAPLVEHQHYAIVIAGSRLHTAGSGAAREEFRSRTQRYDNLAQGQLSHVTAPSRHTTENWGSDNADADADDEVVMHSYDASLEADQINEQSTPPWLRTPSKGREHVLFEDERY
jgi:hypothetical protein